METSVNVVVIYPNRLLVEIRIMFWKSLLFLCHIIYSRGKRHWKGTLHKYTLIDCDAVRQDGSDRSTPIECCCMCRHSTSTAYIIGHSETRYNSEFSPLRYSPYNTNMASLLLFGCTLKLTRIKSIPFCRTILINIINNLELLINLLNDQSLNSSRILLSPKCSCVHMCCAYVYRLLSVVLFGFSAVYKWCVSISSVTRSLEPAAINGLI